MTKQEYIKLAEQYEQQLTVIDEKIRQNKLLLRKKRHRPEAAKTFTCSTGDHADRMQMYGAVTAGTGRGG